MSSNAGTSNGSNGGMSSSGIPEGIRIFRSSKICFKNSSTGLLCPWGFSIVMETSPVTNNRPTNFILIAVCVHWRCRCSNQNQIAQHILSHTLKEYMKILWQTASIHYTIRQCTAAVELAPPHQCKCNTYIHKTYHVDGLFKSKSLIK